LAVLDGCELTTPARDAADLLALVGGQDVAQGDDGVFRIVRGVARDRVISTVDPEARHGHKSQHRRFDGYKAHLSVDPDSELVDEVVATPADTPDRDAVDDLVADHIDADAALAMTEEATAQGQRGVARFGQYVLTRVEMSAGRFDAARAAAGAATEDDDAFTTELTLPELVEAAMRTGRRDLALAACTTLSHRAQVTGTHWGLGLAARARGLVSDGADAEEAYRDAIDHLAQTSALVDLARTHLLFGERLRRAKRRTDARHHLGIAHEMFLGMGAESLAERAGGELVATGARARRRTPATSLDLTPQEARVSDLATEGASNSEIAAQLFLSASTVEYHLRKVFRKLDVTSRTQLARRILEQKRGGVAIVAT
jgi:DNA-binding NarL/FixJ family response regulator